METFIEFYNIAYIEDLEDELDIHDGEYSEIYWDETIGKAIVVLTSNARDFFNRFRGCGLSYQVIPEDDFLNIIS